MKKLSTLSLLSLLATAPAHAVIDTLDNVPAATLLLPYFAVDLTNPAERTLARVGNVSGNEVLAHAVLWTDRGVPTLGFDLRLAAYDVAEIDLRALFASGNLPQTSAGSFASCAGTLPPPSLSAATQTALRNAHRGQASALLGGNCGGVNHSDNVARGYLTLDVVNQCTSSTTFPATPGYFVAGGNGIARNDNLLFGEYATYDSILGTAQGDALVAIEASTTNVATDGPDNQFCYPSYATCPVPTPYTIVPDYTFYRRVIGSAADHREALPESWFGRYQNDAPETQTTALVWRDPGAVDAFPCGNPPTKLGLQKILAFDEQEHPATNCPLVGTLPYAAQAVNLSDPSKFSVPFQGGFIDYNLGRTQAEGALGLRNQGFVTHQVHRVWAATLSHPHSVETGQLPAWPLRPITDLTGSNYPVFICPSCLDGIDNDGDGQIDFPNDLQCRASFGVENPECSDGIDNDGDGKIDWPDDPECWGPLDRIELDNPPCDDGIDNDGDGLIDWPSDPRCGQNPSGNEAEGICGNGLDDDGDGKIDYPADPGCTSRYDNNETDPQCRDGLDNDGDGKTDFPADGGCTSLEDNDESNPCSDGIDNDGDGLTDYPNDPGCASATAPTESPQCDDGIDNDGDGLTDYPYDPGCSSATGPTESPQCDDGIDNDGDGLTDYPYDPGCASATGPTESPQCNDNWDNDYDGQIDYPNDPDCAAASGAYERPPECSDGIDNDGNGLIDYPNDPACSSATDDSELTPQCSDGQDNDGNGLTDYPYDPGCDSPGDLFEGPDCRDRVYWVDTGTDPPTPYYSPLDNDYDGLANYPDDPGCASSDDYNELGATTTRQCSDGIDNDGDGKIDFPADRGCFSAWDDLEYTLGDEELAPPVRPIPALSPSGLLLAGLLLGLVAFGARRLVMKG